MLRQEPTHFTVSVFGRWNESSSPPLPRVRRVVTMRTRTERRTMDRQRQIELMESVEERTAGHVRRWIETTPKLKALLHRRERDDGAHYQAVKRVCVGGR